MKILILYSGGLDSVMMDAYARMCYPDAEILKVFFKHGQESEAAEMAALPPDVLVRDLQWLDDVVKPVGKPSAPRIGNIYIPGRNLVFATAAACQFMPDEIWMGSLTNEAHVDATDKNETFAKMASETLSYVLSPFRGPVKVRLPFVELGFDKLGALSYLIGQHAMSIQDALDSASCWHFHDRACGKCYMCLQRALVLWHFGVTDEYDGLHPLDPENADTRPIIKHMLSLGSPPSVDETPLWKAVHKWWTAEGRVAWTAHHNNLIN